MIDEVGLSLPFANLILMCHFLPSLLFAFSRVHNILKNF